MSDRRARHPRTHPDLHRRSVKRPGRSARIYLEDGAVLIADGRIEAVGEALDILAARRQARQLDDHSGRLIMPGFIDAHIHYPQTQVIGSYGAQLLDWLHNYTFVEEQKFADPAPLRRIAAFFLDELVPLRHDDGDGLLHGPSAIGRRVLRRGGAARHAHDRRQGDDGPRRARGADRHRRSAATTKARR